MVFDDDYDHTGIEEHMHDLAKYLSRLLSLLLFRIAMIRLLVISYAHHRLRVYMVVYSLRGKSSPFPQNQTNY